MSIIFIERAFTNSPHLFIEAVWPCYTVEGEIESLLDPCVNPI